MAKIHVKPFNFTHLHTGDNESPATIIKGNASFTPITIPDEEIEEVTYTAEQLEESEKEGYERGKIDGTNQGRKDSFELDQKIVEAVNKIAPTMQGLFLTYTKKIEDSSSQTVALAMQIAQKIAGDALAENPLPLIEKTTKECLQFLFKEPEVSIIVHDTLAAPLKERMSDIISSSGFDGKVDIIGNPNITLGDCKIEWKGGGAEINAEARTQQIEEIVNAINKTPIST